MPQVNPIHIDSRQIFDKYLGINDDEYLKTPNPLN